MSAGARPSRTPTGQRGFTMFEILVTLFLITLWLLASAGVQSSSLQYSKAAQFRTQAVYLATDLAERMQANVSGAVAGSYVLAETSLSASDIQSVNTCLTAVCPPETLAGFDLADWKGRVAAVFLNQNASVAVSTNAVANPITYTIVIRWSDRRSERTYATSGTAEAFSYTATKTVFNPPS